MYIEGAFIRKSCSIALWSIFIFKCNTAKSYIQIYTPGGCGCGSYEAVEDMVLDRYFGQKSQESIPIWGWNRKPWILKTFIITQVPNSKWWIYHLFLQNIYVFLGFNCESCAVGYYGNATIGTPDDCRQCPCSAPKTLTPACDVINGAVTCLNCAPGHLDPLCNRWVCAGVKFIKTACWLVKNNRVSFFWTN